MPSKKNVNLTSVSSQDSLDERKSSNGSYLLRDTGFFYLLGEGVEMDRGIKVLDSRAKAKDRTAKIENRASKPAQVTNRITKIKDSHIKIMERVPKIAVSHP